jgi:hypothetical protein
MYMRTSCQLVDKVRERERERKRKRERKKKDRVKEKTNASLFVLQHSI